MQTISRTFAVADVHPAFQPLKTTPLGQLARRQLENLESVSDYHLSVVPCENLNPLLFATFRAFLDHRPLILSPDMLWVTILQGLARHVEMRAEELRPSFVNHQGQLKLRVAARDFVLGSPENPWEEVVEGFCTQLESNLRPAARELLAPPFSTSGLTERVACQVAMMSALKSYFVYEAVCICGIPIVTLEGTSEDWKALRDRARRLGSFGLEWWTGCLVPILDQFVAASEGRVDLRFWKDIYQEHPSEYGGYGGPRPTFSGWIGCFFPFLKRGERNPLVLGRRPDRRGLGIYLDGFDPGMALAPVTWVEQGRKIGLQFLAGLMGVEQKLETLALRPKVAWAVRRT